MVVRGGREIDFFKTALLLAAFAFLILALARPQWGERFESLDIRGLEIVFLLDTSASMNAEDLQPSRLEVAKNLIAAIVDALRTDMVSQVNFAAVAYVQCPPTLDYEAFKLLALASAASPEEEQGTDFAKGLALALRMFRASRSSQKVHRSDHRRRGPGAGLARGGAGAAEAEGHGVHRGRRHPRAGRRSPSWTRAARPSAGKRTARAASSSRSSTRRR